jgi:translation initiation factor 2B subunit (eIF-2B alpha/beta/delta family)
LNYNDIQKKLEDLRTDNTSGANELIDKALEIIKILLESIEEPNVDIKEELFTLAKNIIDSRPSMAPLINTIGFLIHDLEIMNKKILEERINQFYVDRTERQKALAQAFRTFFTNKKITAPKIMLISYSSTILNQLIENKDCNFEIFILESRPLLEGIRVAETLSSYFKTNLIIDAAMGKFIDQIDLILIGVDSVLKEGSIINKIGTFPLAVLANERNIDVYVVGDYFKYNLNSYYGKEIVIEEKPNKELYSDESQKELLKIHNYYFDITPPKFITGIISDLGILLMEEFLKLAKENLPIEWYEDFL